MSRLQQLAGFQSPLNWKLYVALALPWTFFVLMRLPMLFPSVFCRPYIDNPLFHALPGECYWHTSSEYPRYSVGIYVHLGSVLPAGLLAVLQFTPRMRQKYRALHRVAGYLSSAGVLVGNAAALAICDAAFGGDMATQMATFVLASMTTYGILRAVDEARRKNIQAHRVWMLRTWAWLGAILTMRPIMGLLVQYMSVHGRHWFGIPCREMIFRLNETGDDLAVAHNWPVCDPNSSVYDLDGIAAVRATDYGNHVEELAAVRASFGPALWLGLMIHAVAVEWYLAANSQPRKTAAVAKGSAVGGRTKSEKEVPAAKK